MTSEGIARTNFLGKEDSVDNLMRVCSKEIAAELPELTFGKRKFDSDWMKKTNNKRWMSQSIY